MSAYEQEFAFLKKVLAKSRIELKLLSEEETEPPLEAYRTIGESVLKAASDLRQKCVYRIVTPFRLRFILMRLSEGEKDILLIGPFMTDIPTPDEIKEIANELNLSHEEADLIATTFPDIPKLPGAGLIFIITDSFAEAVWPGETIRTVEINTKEKGRESSLQMIADAGGGDTSMLYEYKKDLINRRYQSENEMMSVVTNGQVEAAKHVTAHLTVADFDKRSVNPVRNAKNYCIIMNTLLRKAAEKGGVHPIHLDTLSSSIAYRIEETSTTEGILRLMHEMPSSYSTLVREYSYSRYSEAIQKVLVTIDCNIDKNLSLEYLADMASLSENYLSARFKKEVGTTLSDYITNIRISYASRLMAEQNRTIQEAANESGFSDVHYFTRVFHKKMGMTPGEYIAQYKGRSRNAKSK